MRKFSLCIVIQFLFLCSSHGQKVYLPTVESLKDRTTPAWFGNAKLGIFIHWGLYSVPAWAEPTISVDKVTDWKEFYRNNPYAEWYLNSLRIKNSPTKAYHAQKYGSDFDYYKFKDTLAFKTTTWKADSWIEIFQNIGARYVVITSKHHDGFMMYPSTVTNPFYRGGELCSSRDFVGELAEAARKKGLKFGVYYSGGLDWTFNHSPITNLWPDLFHSMPTSIAYTMYADCQVHEIIHKYKPDILWNDVNYPKNGDLLGIFSELFNTNPNAVINDRWEQYQELSDYKTPEYKVLDSISTKKWETCRGLGYSFGYNQREDEKQVISSADLIRLFVDIVSKNGNLLLNIGPKADGTIPQIQLDRLHDLGKWLKINGEGIFDTQAWKIANYHNANGLDLRFTQKGNDLYVFIFSLSKNNVIQIPYLNLTNHSEVVMVGEDKGKINFKQSAEGIEIQLTKQLKGALCPMIKISNVQK
ncbi:MAG: alpha-L-fucosidase [Thermoflexibacter sp.]|jgi:alpha-L-fucosidase|nr:alpha-L-fucosidase [Thermoflexibacter sp.]